VKSRSEQTAKPADLSQHLGTMCLPNEPMNTPLQTVSKINVNARACVSLYCCCHAIGRAPGSPNRAIEVNRPYLDCHVERSRDISHYSPNAEQPNIQPNGSKMTGSALGWPT
jgi:hypothetical protein